MQPERERRARLSVKVVARGRRNEIVGWVGDRLKLKVAAPREGGRANDALVAFLAEQVALPRRSVRIVAGHTATSKIVEFDGIEQAELERRFGSPAG
jgi:uncharacterized protein